MFPVAKQGASCCFFITRGQLKGVTAHGWKMRTGISGPSPPPLSGHAVLPSLHPVSPPSCPRSGYVRAGDFPSPFLPSPLLPPCESRPQWAPEWTWTWSRKMSPVIPGSRPDGPGPQRADLCTHLPAGACVPLVRVPVSSLWWCGRALLLSEDTEGRFCLVRLSSCLCRCDVFLCHLCFLCVAFLFVHLLSVFPIRGFPQMSRDL